MEIYLRIRRLKCWKSDVFLLLYSNIAGFFYDSFNDSLNFIRDFVSMWSI